MENEEHDHAIEACSGIAFELSHWSVCDPRNVVAEDFEHVSGIAFSCWAADISFRLDRNDVNSLKDIAAKKGWVWDVRSCSSSKRVLVSRKLLPGIKMSLPFLSW
jgi:hypothetical protein